MPQSVRENAKLIDQKLSEIKVCDPAIGSGAFPVGMMTEIVRARNTLSNYLKEPGRTLYNFKRDCIQNSLYGVDLDPGAVEIAKLRLWLSLVVDEDDIKQIKPLPNLELRTARTYFRSKLIDIASSSSRGIKLNFLSETEILLLYTPCSSTNRTNTTML